MTLKEAERNAIIAALAETGGNKAKAARILGISEKGLYNKLYKHELQFPKKVREATVLAFRRAKEHGMPGRSSIQQG